MYSLKLAVVLQKTSFYYGDWLPDYPPAYGKTSKEVEGGGAEAGRMEPGRLRLARQPAASCRL